MHIMHLALGGCLKAPPIDYGITEDTGGHIAYILGAASEQARCPAVRRIDLVTRGFADDRLGLDYAKPETHVDDVIRIRRLLTERRAYLDKDDLAEELPALTDAFIALLRRDVRPDVIHAHFADAAHMAFAAREAYGIPVVYTPHSLGIGKRTCIGGDAGLSRRIGAERDAVARADAIVVSSRNEAEDQVQAYDATAAGRVHRIDPGVQLPAAPAGTSRAKTLLAPFLRDLDKPLVLAIARPVAKKNLRALLTAFAATDGLRRAANLAIVAGQRDAPDTGSPEQCEQITALLHDVDRHDLWGRVALPRRHSGAEVTQLYRLAAATGGVFVNPALHEPFGLTLIEAARVGLPVVATDRGGPADIVATIGHGETVAPEDTAALGDAILRTVTDGGLRARRAAAALENHDLFSWPIYARRSVALYRRLTAHPAKIRSPISKGPGSMERPDRMLVCDIDGTLTGSLPAARRFRDWAKARRMPFVVATGRSMPEARRVLAKWELPEPDLFITSVGTEIYRPDRLGRAGLDQAFAESIAQGWDPDAVEAALRVAGARPQAPIEQRAFKRSYHGDTNDAVAILRALRRNGIDANVVASHGRFIDVLPARAGKAHAVDFVARRLGLTLDDCIACGDSGNDACMLRASGTAIVVGNALPEIAALPLGTGVIRTRSRYADGVLEGLSRLGIAVPPPAFRQSYAAERTA